MRRETIEKLVLSYIMIYWLVLLPRTGYTSADTENVVPHLAYMWSHANWWHLAGNLFVLWIMRGRLYLCPSLIIACLASFLPAWSLYGEVGMTLGFSGVIFAMAGIKWGTHCRDKYGMYVSADAFREFTAKALPFALIGIFIPHLNWCIHLYSLLAGYVYGRCRR